MPSLEDIYSEVTHYPPYGRYEDPLPRRKARYSTRAIRRRLEIARQRANSEPSSLAEAIERGLNYYWSAGE